METSNFLKVYSYADSLVAMEFENLDFPVWSFDKRSYKYMQSIQKIMLIYMFTAETRQLVFSRIMSQPITQMQNKVDYLLKKVQNSSKVKYWIYSGHDDQISNMIVWLHPNNIEMDSIPFASQIVYELKYD